MFTRITVIKMVDKYHAAFTTAAEIPDVPDYSPFVYSFIGKRERATGYIAGYLEGIGGFTPQQIWDIAAEVIEDADKYNRQELRVPANTTVEHSR